MHLRTDDPLKSPVFASELVSWARLDSDDPMIESALIAATSAVFAFLKQDLTTRTWTATFEDWPTNGTYSYPSISPANYGSRRRIELPYTNLISIDEVRINGELEAEYRIIKGKPYCIQFDNWGYTTDDIDALAITYKAGYGESTADVPEAIRKAIMLAATYIIAHNGECDAGDSLSLSGAKPLLVPYAVKAGITI